MRLQGVEVGQAHVITVFAAQISIGIVGHAHLYILEARTAQWKEFLLLAGGMEWHTQGMAKGCRRAATGSQTDERIDDAMVEPIPEIGDTACLLLAEARLAQLLVHMPQTEARKLVEPQRARCLGHDVDVDATQAEHTVVAALFAQETAPVAQLGIGIEIMGVGGMVLQGHAGRQFIGQQAQQTHIVGHEHLHIEVIVPGDEASMAHASEQGARTDPIRNAVTGADGIEHLQHLLHAHLMAAQQGAFGIEPCL